MKIFLIANIALTCVFVLLGFGVPEQATERFALLAFALKYFSHLLSLLYLFCAFKIIPSILGS